MKRKKIEKYTFELVQDSVNAQLTRVSFQCSNVDAFITEYANITVDKMR